MSNRPPVNSVVAAPERRAVQLSTAQQNFQTITETLKSNQGADARAIRAMLGGDKKLMDRFLATVFSLLARESNILQQATPASIIDAIKTAASLGLEPMTEDGAIVVHGNIASFMPMWRGYLKRIRRSREVVEIDTQVVYENDEFSLEFGTNPGIHHIPAKLVKDNEGKIVQDRGSYMGAYAWALMPSGIRLIEWMTEAEINHTRDTYSNRRTGSGPNPWANEWGEMARKTVLRRFSKRLPSAAVDQLLAADSEADKLAEQVTQLSDGMDDLRRLARMRVAPAVDAPVEQPGMAPGTAHEQAGTPGVEASSTPSSTAPSSPFEDRG